MKDATAIARALAAEVSASETVAPPREIVLLPAGRLEATDGREPWTLGNAEAVLAASPAEIVIDFDHASARPGPAPAAGWAKLAARDGAILAAVAWTPDGEAALRERSYRYLSPEILYHRQSREILAVKAAALVNRPGLRSQAERALMSEDAGELVAMLAARFGLAADAGAAEIAAFLDEERACEALSFGLHRDASTAEIATARRALHHAGVSPEAEAGRAVDRAIKAGAITPAQRSAAVALAEAAPAAFAQFTGGDARFAYLAHRLAPAGVPRSSGGDVVAEVAAALKQPVSALETARKQLSRSKA
ncbi:MAG: hypothetical protein F4Z60_12265 [Chloroflexi bacterium]|nr:hypothetical protein [Chloroflexota bacterium]